MHRPPPPGLQEREEKSTRDEKQRSCDRRMGVTCIMDVGMTLDVDAKTNSWAFQQST